MLCKRRSLIIYHTKHFKSAQETNEVLMCIFSDFLIYIHVSTLKLPPTKQKKFTAKIFDVFSEFKFLPVHEKNQAKQANDYHCKVLRKINGSEKSWVLKTIFVTRFVLSLLFSTHHFTPNILTISQLQSLQKIFVSNHKRLTICQ